MRSSKQAGSAPTAVVILLLVSLLVAAWGWRAERQRSEEAKATYQEGLAQCGSEVGACREESGKNRQQSQVSLAAAKDELTQYNRSAELDPRLWFRHFSGEVANRVFLARLTLHWHSEFELDDTVGVSEVLQGGRELREVRDQQQVTRSSAGFLLGRRSNYLFGLIMVSRADPGFAAPDGSFLALPPKAHIATPLFTPDRYPDYKLVQSSVQLEVEVLAGCPEGAPASIVHAWRTKDFFALVIGCDAPLGGKDLDLFPYEGFRRFAAFSEREVAFPGMTPNGGVAMSLVCLDRRFGEAGTGSKRLGMPWSISATFLPVDNAYTATPVLHSLAFQIDDKTEWRVPFWAVRKQLASAQEIFDLAAALELPYSLVPSASTDPGRRKPMLVNYENLINKNEEHVSTVTPQLAASGPACSTSAAGGF